MDQHPEYNLNTRNKDFNSPINDIHVAYEDRWILIVDKPPGLLTIPTPKRELRTLNSILDDEAKKNRLTYRLYPCHRLDRETSGLIIYAKGKSVQRKMMEEFKKRRIKKIYTAFVHGPIKDNRGQIKKPINGRHAITRFRILERRRNFTILEIMPLTGRKNQIRIHFRSIGHPLVGETRFAFRKDFILKAKRACLHARTLEFNHPVTGRKVSVVSEMPGDLIRFLKNNN